MAKIEIEYRIISCPTPSCGISFGIHEGFVHRLENNHREFYCPNGHTIVYKAETEEDILRKVMQRKDKTIDDLYKELRKARAKKRNKTK